MSESKLRTLLLLVGLVAYRSVIGSNTIDAGGQVTTADVNAKIALMEKVINSLVQRSQVAENKLHTVETQMTEHKARDDKLIQGLNTQMKALQDQVQTVQQEKALQEKDVKSLTTKMQQAHLQIQNLQQDKTTSGMKLQELESKIQQQTSLATTLTQATTQLQVLESQILQLTSCCKEVKDSPALLKAHQSILTAWQANQAAILKNIENIQAGVLNKQSTFANQLKNQEMQLTNQKSVQTKLENKQVEITSQQTQLVGELANRTQHILIQQGALENVSQKQVAMETAYNTRLNVLEKHRADSEFRLTNLESFEKKSTKIHIAMANQKFSDIFLQQFQLKQAINNNSAELSGLIQNDVAIQATQKLTDTKIQDLILKQQVMDRQILAHAGQINKLDTKVLTNRLQVAWTGETYTDNGIIKSLNFIKKNAGSGLRVSFYGNLMSLTTSGGVCSRWWFELNGKECTNPAVIDGVMYTRDLIDNHFRPGVVSGICNGIPAGNVNVVFKIGKCPNNYPLGNAHTGWQSASRIIIEEI